MGTDSSLSPDASSAAEESQSAEDSTGGLSEEESLAAELAVLEAENERLRSEYARLQQNQYRQSALALFGLGLVALVGGLLFSPARTVLFALAGTGLFLGVLTYFLSPEQFLPATVGRRVYETLATNEYAITDELGLADRHLYVPREDQSVRLYVPQSDADAVPEREHLSETFVVTDESRGVAFEPTGGMLFEEFEQALTATLAEEPDELSRQLCDALVEQFELVAQTERSVPAETTSETGELTVGITDSVYGPIEQFDHPVSSFIAVGLATSLDIPVEVSVTADGTDRADAVVSYRWPTTDEDD